MSQPLESGDELVIEDRYLTIEGQSGLRQRTDYPGEFTKAPRVIPTIPAEELDLPVTLESQNPPSVVFLFVDPPLSMEGA